MELDNNSRLHTPKVVTKANLLSELSGILLHVQPLFTLLKESGLATPELTQTVKATFQKFDSMLRLPVIFCNDGFDSV